MIEVNEKYVETEVVKKKIDWRLDEYRKRGTVVRQTFKERKAPLSKDIYTIEDFTRYHNEEFVEYLYQNILRRKPNRDEVLFYTDLLRTGKALPGELVALVRFSPEGKEQGVTILGIKKRYLLAKLFRIPLFGYFFRWLFTLVTLPKVVQRHSSLVYHVMSENKRLNTTLQEMQAKLVSHTNTLEILQEELYGMEQSLSQKIETGLATLDADLSRRVDNQQHYILQIQKRINSTLEKVMKMQHESSKDAAEPLQEHIKSEKKSILDKLYIDFEDKFRGSREGIKERQKYYLADVLKVTKELNLGVVDLGCGRGEWLEVLKEESIPAQGVDLNELMVAEAQNYGVDALYKDALEYLKSLDENSVGVVSGFHIVEHLPFEVLLEILDEAYRVLAPKGMVLFETPNPENIYVGSCSFYTDPTHINPIPPVTLEFLLYNRGFRELQTHRLHPIKEAEFLPGEGMKDVNDLIFSATKAQDYAVMGYKI